MIATNTIQLAIHVTRQSNEAKAKVASGEWLFACFPSLPSLLARGIDSVAKLERESLESYCWDAHKDAFGIRPRGFAIAEMSDKRLREFADYIAEELTFQRDSEIAREKEIVLRANRRALARRKFDQRFNSIGTALTV